MNKNKKITAPKKIQSKKIQVKPIRSNDFRKRTNHTCSTGWYTTKHPFDHVIRVLRRKGIKKNTVSERDMVKYVNWAITANGHWAATDVNEEIRGFYWHWVNSRRGK